MEQQQQQQQQRIPIDIWKGPVAEFLSMRQLRIVRCVSKEWRKAFNEAFMRIFRQRFPVTQNSLLRLEEVLHISEIYRSAVRSLTKEEVERGGDHGERTLN
jgi:hypothetical protein